MHRDSVADKMLLRGMVRKSTRRRLHVSAGHPLRDSIHTDAVSSIDSVTPQSPKRLIQHLSTLNALKYAVPLHIKENERGDDDKPSGKSYEVIASRRRHGAIATSLVGAPSPLPLTQLRTDPQGAAWNRAVYRRALTSVHKLNALGSLSLSKHPQPRAGDTNSPAPSPSQQSRAWFRDLQATASAPPPQPIPGSYRHSKWQHVTYGSSIYLESCATKTCLLFGGSGKSVGNARPRHSANPGSLLRIVDFTNPFRRGSVFHGDDVWLRLDDFCPDLPTKRDPITTYVKEVQHYVSWGERANGLTGQTSCLANVLETLVPSIAHYGYDTSMAECLGEIHAAMHLAKWTIEAVGSSTQGDENDDVYDRDDYCHRPEKDPPNSSWSICNYAIVHLRQEDRFLIVDKTTGLTSIQHRQGTSSPRKAKTAQWRVCVRDPMAATHLTSSTHEAGNIVVKASVNLVESHQRATTFLGTKNDIVTDQIETHQASRTHLAMIHDAKETHAVEYFTHKFKTAAMARQR